MSWKMNYLAQIVSHSGNSFLNQREYELCILDCRGFPEIFGAYNLVRTRCGLTYIYAWTSCDQIAARSFLPIGELPEDEAFFRHDVTTEYGRFTSHQIKRYNEAHGGRHTRNDSPFFWSWHRQKHLYRNHAVVIKGLTCENDNFRA